MDTNKPSVFTSTRMWPWSHHSVAEKSASGTVSSPSYSCLLVFIRGCTKGYIFKFVLVMLGLGAFVLPARADTHIFAGALGTNQNDKLFFSNGAAFDATQSSFSFPQILRTNGL